ncbi:hypothetical protein PInf_023146 [Phytophthora infestans]|nr:hypothetical protein PInf_023146 [Phytophthora infestans]
MRTDMRDAKDTAMDLKHVAHEINRDQKPTKTEIASARNMMNSTARAIETLKATARNYDRENQQRMGVKGRVDAAVGGHGERSAFAASSSSSSSESDGGLFGKKDSGEKRRNISNEDNNGGRVVGSSETVETLVRKVLRDNFSLSTLNSQIKAAENSLTPSLMERAKEKMHDVKEKIKGDKSEPVHEGHGYPHEGHHHQQTVMP